MVLWECTTYLSRRLILCHAMEKEQVVVINIYWERVPLDEISTKNTIQDRGIYQIYGQHSAYGENTFLYIGKTCDQLFAHRLGDGRKT